MVKICAMCARMTNRAFDGLNPYSDIFKSQRLNYFSSVPYYFKSTPIRIERDSSDIFLI